VAVAAAVDLLVQLALVLLHRPVWADRMVVAVVVLTAVLAPEKVATVVAVLYVLFGPVQLANFLQLKLG
jgi:hypothetical protein